MDSDDPSRLAQKGWRRSRQPHALILFLTSAVPSSVEIFLFFFISAIDFFSHRIILYLELFFKYKTINFIMQAKKYEAPAAAAALEILEFMAGNPGVWGPTELARRLNLSPNLVFRVLAELQERGYVGRTSSGQYELTAGLFSLGMKLQNNFDLRKQARPFLEELSAELRETSQIQIPAGPRMLQLDSVPPTAEYYLSVTPGIRLHWHGNAFGKAVLAFLEESEIDAILSAPLPRLTPHTIVDPEVIRSELAEIRSSYCSEEFDEYVLGSYCVGSPVFDAAGHPVAGIGITGLSSRLNREELPRIRDHVKACARRISASIGFKQSFEGKQS